MAEPGKLVASQLLVGAAPTVNERQARAQIVPSDNSTHVMYPVFFGTDRLPTTPYDGVRTSTFLWLSGAWGLAIVCSTVFLFRGMSLWAWRAGIALVVLSAGMAVIAFIDVKPRKTNEFATEAFRDGRGDLKCGLCTVSIPRDHQAGMLEAPSLLKFEFREDPAKHIVLQRVDLMEMSQFKEEVAQYADDVSWPEALVFVHGYNVSFEDAARRCAQLSHDLEFGGISAFFSWPSNGSTLAYTWDEESVQYAVPHFIEFLQVLAKAARLKRIHVISHSMGNRCVLEALKGRPNLGDCGLDQCIFAAPDVDRTKFEKDIAALNVPHTTEVGGPDRMTLYASAKDLALNLSQKVHRYPRAGDARPSVLVSRGFESIEASLLETDYLGHSYFGDSPHLINDLKQLIIKRLPASMRQGMHRVPVGARSYWRFQP